MHHAQALAEFGHVLPVLQLLDQVSLGTVLLMCQGLEHTVAVEQPRDLGEALLQPALGSCRHTPILTAAPERRGVVTTRRSASCKARWDPRPWQVGAKLSV